jgi:hypothetical protein
MRVDSYLLEARYLECQLLLDSSSLAFGTDEMKQVIQNRKRFTLEGFSKCLQKTPERANETEPYPARLGACLHQVMVRSVNRKELLFKPRHLNDEERAGRTGEGLEKQETTVKAVVKPPEHLDEEKKQPEEHATAPRDARSTRPSPGQGGAGAGNSRDSGPKDQGVASVLASQISEMTASLTAPNTVFEQEIKDRLDLGTRRLIGPTTWTFRATPMTPGP